MHAHGLHLVPHVILYPSGFKLAQRLLVFSGIAAFLGLFWWGFITGVCACVQFVERIIR